MQCGGPPQLYLPFRLFLLLLLCLQGPLPSLGFKICAFNVQQFGVSKASKPKILHDIVRTVSRCDVMLLQEVRDAKQTALKKLLVSVNRYDEKYHYDYVSSEPLGQSQGYHEQYVFFYRKETVNLVDQWQYPDNQKGDEDAFSRPPFIVRLKAPKTAIKEFVLIPLHAAPKNATKEIDELYDVSQLVKEKWGIENMLFLGDFNAACGYVAKKNKKNIRLMTQPGYFWLIKDSDDTTVRESTSCAYDRFVVHGEVFLKKIVPFSARVFPFDKKFHLAEEQALDMSDHYPIELDLRSSAQRLQAPLSMIFIAVCILFLSLA